jgi:hypothetical protein
MRPVRSIATSLLVAGVLLSGVAVAGCGGNQPDQRVNPTASAPPVSASPAASEPSVTTVPPAADGQTKSEPVVLADGRHPVYLKTVDAGRRTVTFDLIQWYFGDDAAREAATDHKESPPPNDYYIRNVSPRLRTLPVRADATITVNTLAAGYTGSAIKDVPVSLSRLASLLGRYSPLFWITVRHDQVVKIAEQYLP